MSLWHPLCDSSVTDLTCTDVVQRVATVAAAVDSAGRHGRYAL